MENVVERPEYMDRIDRLKTKVFETYPEIDLENARILTESFLQTRGEALVMRKAKAFRKQCMEKTVKIWDDELVVGNAGSKIRGGILSADVCWSVLDKELETINSRPYDKFHLTEEDKKLFEDFIRPNWKGLSNYEAWLARIPSDVAALRDNGALYIDKKAVRGWGEVTAGYEWFIKNGAEGIIEKIKARRARLDGAIPGDYEKEVYLDALLIAAEGLVILGERYAAEAARMASLEGNPIRRKELEDIAAICRRVPAKPATTFREAVQSFYFYQAAVFMEQNAAAYNPGRMDQYLYPYYEKDLNEGRITQDGAQEILDCRWVKFSEPCLFQDEKSAEYASGYPMFQNVCAGGINTMGQDAVNDLSYMIIQATMDTRLYQPSLSVRYNMAKNPTSFLRKIVELMSLGTGFPAFHNDEVGIRMLMNKGIPLKEALDWNPGGCVETNLAGKLRHYSALADINLGSIVEYVMLDGLCRKSGQRVGPRTGNPADFRTFNDFMAAVKAQLHYIIKIVVKASHIIDEICMDRPVPALSLSFEDCIENAKDYAWGGAKYNTGNGIICIGVSDLINSVAAVRHLVYDTKELSMPQLLDALACNFEGVPDVLKMCLSAPKYGNDDQRVDGLAAELFSYIADEIESYSSKFGRMTPGILPVSGNTPFGCEVGALPSGRRAWKPLADGVSPNSGTDVNGPSSVLKSVANIPHDRFVQGTLLNLKLAPEMISSENGIQHVMALLKSLCNLGIYHVQFNVVKQQHLIEAQEHPQEHRDLLIRVAGYTAFFVELGRDVQNDIIARTVQTKDGAKISCG
ncbi:MAG: formate C-acetyltransferase/glycerol dehydratase family glycyl radical enzyme [Synergistaceae bacterium]|jgi:formate C-acetyltransferase|nr:formate C-acetyltransferase/glycerol dehydratase family glycyl radical enzyme [Synergistaceae bacterium]